MLKSCIKYLARLAICGVSMKIVSLSSPTIETLVLLGLEDEIVGVTPWCKMYLNNPDKEVVGTYL